MKLLLLFATLYLFASTTTTTIANALSPSEQSMVGAISRAVNRRTAFTGVTAAAVALGSMQQEAKAAVVGPEAFVGTFTDPINHPGGTRTISLLDGKQVGDYQLAQVQGGGGKGEPSKYILPAAIIGDRTIVIDFSPKGGPRDFVGVLDIQGDIKFLKDGNRWPRQ